MGIPFLDSVPPWASVTVLLVDFVIRIVALAVIPHNRRPSAAWGWLLAIFFVPLLGMVAYWLIGRSDLPPARRQKQRSIRQPVSTGDRDAVMVGDASGLPGWVLAAARMNHHNGGMPLTAGNRVDILDDYDQTLRRLTEVVRGAASSVRAEFYITALDQTTEPFIQALEDAHRRGVAVRVLIDHLGSVGFPGYKEVVQRLDAAGVPWRRMLPVRPWRGEYQRPDLRNHRKILVVDGKVAFTGSQNVIAPSYNKKRNLRKQLQWKDLLVELEGPVVQGLNEVFLADWSSETGEPAADDLHSTTSAPDAGRAPDSQGPVLCQLLPSGPGFDNQSNLRLFNHLIYSARHRLVVAAPYLVPDESLFHSITTAVQRGVEVQLYMSEAADHVVTHHAQRSYYEMLLEAGARIFLHEPPYILHSKFVLVDEHVAVVASSNMDIRSFVLNLEVSLMICDADFVSRMLTVEQHYRRASRELALDDWLSRPRRQKYVEDLCRLTAALQ